MDKRELSTYDDNFIIHPKKKKIDDNHNFFHTFSCIDELGTSLFLT